MSLAYQNEHLAWQQRIGQEKLRAERFFQKVGGFPVIDPLAFESRAVFPNGSVNEPRRNYRDLKHTLEYAFGGTKPFRHSFKRKNERKGSACFKGLENELKEIKDRCGSLTSVDGRLWYIKKLGEKVAGERKERIKLQKRLVE